MPQENNTKEEAEIQYQSDIDVKEDVEELKDVIELNEFEKQKADQIAEFELQGQQVEEDWEDPI